MPVTSTLLRLMGYGLIILSVIVLLLPYPPIAWTRRRLWPGLAAGQAVREEAVAL